MKRVEQDITHREGLSLVERIKALSDEDSMTMGDFLTRAGQYQDAVQRGEMIPLHSRHGHILIMDIQTGRRLLEGSDLDLSELPKAVSKKMKDTKKGQPGSTYSVVTGIVDGNTPHVLRRGGVDIALMIHYTQALDFAQHVRNVSVYDAHVIELRREFYDFVGGIAKQGFPLKVTCNPDGSITALFNDEIVKSADGPRSRLSLTVRDDSDGPTEPSPN